MTHRRATRSLAAAILLIAVGCSPTVTPAPSASDPSVTHETTARPDSFVAELPDDDTVDLIVFGLGRSYREYAVPQGDGRGQWSWPPRI